MLQYVPDQYITQETCNKLVDCNPWQLKCVPNQCITQEMCTRTLERCPWSLECIPNWYVTEQQIRTWCGDDDHCNYDGLIKWHMDIKNGRLKKAKKKRRALTIAWHLSRGWDWCVSENEKKKQKNCGDKPFSVSDDQ